MKVTMISRLEDLNFRNSGTVRNDMRFEYRTRPCHYMEDIDQWATRYGGAYYNYLYRIEDGQAVTPPCGMRSAVPLGGLGAGTVELRADGSLKDWTIFNNSPAGGSKIQLDEAMFYVWAKRQGEDPLLKTLRTHPPDFAPAIEQIDYAGAYPVSRLVFSDGELPAKIALYAFTEFHLYDARASATPAICFTFVLENPAEEALDLSLMFVLPNAIAGAYELDGNALVLRKEGTAPDSGSLAVLAHGDAVAVTSVQAESRFAIQRDFWAYGEFPDSMRVPQKENPIDGAVGRMYYQPRAKRYGSIAARTRLQPGEKKAVTFVLAWHFPHRHHAGENLGNFYTHLCADARSTAEQVLARVPQTLDAIAAWHALCFDNSLPHWLQDALVNSAATIAKTGMWFRDGRWRQWESFSCPGVDPIHIQFYRVLPYAWFFTGLRRSQMRGFAACQREDGYIQENLGRGTDVLDKPIGRMMGDACTTFILQAYQDYLWTGDVDFFDEMWPAVKRATRWQIERASTWGLPGNLNNTYDWWRFESQELVSYNAFLHLAALLAAQKMAEWRNDPVLAAECTTAFSRGQQALDDRLWNGSYYLAYTNAGEDVDTLLSDTLYGQLWANILGLGLLADEEKLLQHLAGEMALNAGPYGLKVMHTAGRESDALPGNLLPEDRPKPRDEIVWEAGSLDWCALNIALTGDTARSLAEAEKIFRKWQDRLQDQWNIRDLSTAWNGEPYCNSHYARQLILWAIPLALSGQQYSAIDGVLSFAPRLEVPYKVPFMTPQACGTLEVTAQHTFIVRVISGCLQVRRLYIDSVLVGEKLALSGDAVFKGHVG